MWKFFKDTIKAILPASTLKQLRPLAHGILAVVASLRYGRPSEKMIVVGVTGTAGKSTTVNLLAHTLNSTGYKTGFVTTANYSYGGETFTNEHGLSMPNEFLLQKQLRLMVARGCKYAILECTSEGLAQNRHWGINFDLVLFTNLSPAHIEAHGSFENYRAAKGKLFQALSEHPRKKIFPKKTIGVNIDDANFEFFTAFAHDALFAVSEKIKSETIPTYLAENITTNPTTNFTINQIPFSIPLFGAFNTYNELLAIGTAVELGIPLTKVAEVVHTFPGMPGRMERIPNDQGFTIFVDYAPEPKGMEEALRSINLLPHNNIIHVFGSTGGHRDVQKRFEFGKISARFADTIIITNDDVYTSNPQEIAENIQEGINQIVADRRAKNVSIILDRTEAISTALSKAQTNDIIIFTGKGSEQFLVLPGNKRIAWDERKIILETLTKIANT